VQQLQDNAGRFDVSTTLAPQGGQPNSPSALAVLETASGLEALVTSAGQDTVFVFAAEAGRLVAVPVPATSLVSTPASSLAVAAATLLSEVPLPAPEAPAPAAATEKVDKAPLVLLVTLQAAPLADTGAVAGEAGGLRGAEGGPLGAPIAALGDAIRAAAVGGEDDVRVLAVALAEGPQPLSPAAPARAPSLDQDLRQLDLYRLSEPPAEPLSRRGGPPAVQEAALAEQPPAGPALAQVIEEVPAESVRVSAGPESAPIGAGAGEAHYSNTDQSLSTLHLVLGWVLGVCWRDNRRIERSRRPDRRQQAGNAPH
jgi:hypothetical protein